MSAPETILASAVAAARADIAVLPLLGKRPLFATGECHAAATTDVDQIEEWWRRWPDANVGIVNGVDSAVFTVDVDVKDGAGGARTLRDLERANGRLPDTWMQLTPSGGSHYLYRWPAGVDRLRRSLGDGVELQGIGRITVLAPSRSANPEKFPHPYGTHRSMEELAEPPRWLVEAGRYTAPKTRPVTCRPTLPPGSTTTRGQKRLEGVTRVLAQAQPGSRHDATLWASARMAEACVAGEIAADVAIAGLFAAAEACGEVEAYTAREVERWIGDGWSMGLGGVGGAR